MITLDSIIRLWEKSLREGDLRKAQSIRYEMTKIMKEIEKEKCMG